MVWLLILSNFYPEAVESVDTHVPQLQIISELESDPELKINFIYVSYEKKALVDNEGGLYVWGQDFDGFEQTEPKLFYKFSQDIKQLAFGLHHGLALTEDGNTYSWGDGTYGELGNPNNTFLEKPAIIRYFSSNNIFVNQIAAGLRHSVCLGNCMILISHI